jgi:subtilisin family serine protease
MPEANIVCVGATDPSDQRPSFSNYGATTVDLSAPGVSIVSTWKGGAGAYAYSSGTSMATPHVAGAAALALAAQPGATTSQLKWALMSSVDVKPALAGMSRTGGRLNAASAVTAIMGPLPAPEPIATPTATPTPEAPTATPTPVAPVATPTPVAPVATATPTPEVTSALLTDVVVGGTLAGKRGRLKVTFKLTRAATVRFTVSQRGRRAAVATWTSKGKTGTNAVTLTRKLPTGATLKSGAYTLGVGLSASAKRSAAIRVR